MLLPFFCFFKCFYFYFSLKNPQKFQLHSQDMQLIPRPIARHDSLQAFLERHRSSRHAITRNRNHAPAVSSSSSPAETNRLHRSSSPQTDDTSHLLIEDSSKIIVVNEVMKSIPEPFVINPSDPMIWNEEEESYRLYIHEFYRLEAERRRITQGAELVVTIPNSRSLRRGSLTARLSMLKLQEAIKQARHRARSRPSAAAASSAPSQTDETTSHLLNDQDKIMLVDGLIHSISKTISEVIDPTNPTVWNEEENFCLFVHTFYSLRRDWLNAKRGTRFGNFRSRPGLARKDRSRVAKSKFGTPKLQPQRQGSTTTHFNNNNSNDDDDDEENSDELHGFQLDFEYVPVDQDLIIDRYTENAEQIAEIKELQSGLNSFVNAQQTDLDRAEPIVDKAAVHVEKGRKELFVAAKVSTSSKWMIGATIGGVVSAFVGFVAGVKSGMMIIDVFRVALSLGAVGAVFAGIMTELFAKMARQASKDAETAKKFNKQNAKKKK